MMTTSGVNKACKELAKEIMFNNWLSGIGISRDKKGYYIVIYVIPGTDTSEFPKEDRGFRLAYKEQEKASAL